MTIQRGKMLRWQCVLEECTLISRAIAQLHSLSLRKAVPHPVRFSSTSYPDGLSTKSRFPLRGEAPRQFLTSNEEVIVCVHPSIPVPITNTLPLRPMKQSMKEKRRDLNPEEVEFVIKLRREDPSLWSIATLARLFKVKNIVISRVAPANRERQEELDTERAHLEAMKPFKKKLYYEKKRMEQQKRLEKVIAERNYKFPCSD